MNCSLLMGETFPLFLDAADHIGCSPNHGFLHVKQKTGRFGHIKYFNIHTR